MRKFAVFNIFLFSSILIAGLYGALHDQVTYTISEEYFTAYKYDQFGFEPSWFGGHRATVAIIGFLATWWTGLIIGIVLGLTSLIFPNYRMMASALRKAVLLVLCIAVVFGIIGGLYGRFYLAARGVSWWLPNDLVDQHSFIIVGSIHNFSYIGGFFGLITGVVFLIYRNSIDRRSYNWAKRPLTFSANSRLERKPGSVLVAALRSQGISVVAPPPQES